MQNQFSRTELLIGREGLERLRRARVAVFGVGGVGGYTVEALTRSGVGALDLIDSDQVNLSNLNRQILATHRTLGQLKVEAARERIAEICPDTVVRAWPVFYGPDTADQFDFSAYDYVVDAIDTVTGKLDLIQRAWQAGTPVISSMGAGNKMDPSAFEVADIYETTVCPLARVMRKELKRRGIPALKVVYSREPPVVLSGSDGEAETLPQPSSGAWKKAIPGSNAFVPAVAGLIMAGEVVRDLTERSRNPADAAL